MHFYSWKKGLKTGMYYLRSKAAADAIQFTVDKSKSSKPMDVTTAENVSHDTIKEKTVVEPAAPAKVDYNKPSDEMSEAEKAALIACSLDNPEACEACGS